MDCARSCPIDPGSHRHVIREGMKGSVPSTEQRRPWRLRSRCGGDGLADSSCRHQEVLHGLIWDLRSSLTCIFTVPHSAQCWIIRSQTLYPIELRARVSSSIAGVSGNDQPIQSMLSHIRPSIPSGSGFS
jgi:hypothetical protein